MQTNPLHWHWQYQLIKVWRTAVPSTFTINANIMNISRATSIRQHEFDMSPMYPKYRVAQKSKLLYCDNSLLFLSHHVCTMAALFSSWLGVLFAPWLIEWPSSATERALNDQHLGSLEDTSDKFCCFQELKYAGKQITHKWRIATLAFLVSLYCTYAKNIRLR